ncbi:C-type lectin domain family 6 member A-like [Liolophura sinensis]|uniref:C-type lectin domain family 6 member A-like n=1 Tax=Liolophura sinensis TaxID=3198878 RepID=UPI0031593F0D
MADSIKSEAHLALCYWMNIEEMEWEESRHACQEKGGDLISLDTDEKFMYLQEAIGNDKRTYWLGGRKVSSGWTWLSGVEISLESPFWHVGQPDSQSQERLSSGTTYFGSFGMDDESSSTKRSSICEMTRK